MCDHFVGLLNTCACVVALEVGRWAHDQIIQCGWDLGALVGSSLVDMYAKCGHFGGCLEILQHTTSSSILLLLKGLPTRSWIPCAKRIIMSHDYLNP